MSSLFRATFVRRQTGSYVKLDSMETSASYFGVALFATTACLSGRCTAPKQTAYRLAGGLCVRVEADELHRLNVWLYEHAERLAIQVHSPPHGGLSLGYRRRLPHGDDARRFVARRARLRPVRRSGS